MTRPSSNTTNPAAPARLVTGVPGLDTVLGGGLLAGSVTILQGSPGAGKTIIGNQMAYSLAREGGRALYVTLLSESHGRLIRHLGTLDFFDRSSLASRVRYVSAFDTLEREGAKGILRLIASEARAFSADLVVLDGLFVLNDAAGSTRDFRLLVNAIALQAEAMGYTTLLLTNAARQPNSPEYTMVDAWIEVCVHGNEYRTFRSLQVHKLRGSDFLPGVHTFTISSEGACIRPRLEVSVRPEDDAPPRGVVTSGHPVLDEKLCGGLDQPSVTLVVGPPGSGKTTLGLHFLSASNAQAPGFSFSFYESPGRLLAKARALDIGFQPLIDTGVVRFHWQLATEAQLDHMAHCILEHVEQHGARRVLIDGLNGFRQTAFFKQRLGPYFSALAHALRRAGCTTLITFETDLLMGDPGSIHVESVSALADNIILLRHGEEGRRLRKTLSVIKTRDRAFDPAICEFTIGSGGMQFASRAQSGTG